MQNTVQFRERCLIFLCEFLISHNLKVRIGCVLQDYVKFVECMLDRHILYGGHTPFVILSELLIYTLQTCTEF